MIADDRHEFGGSWTLAKLLALGNYLPAYRNALKKQSFRLWYIDAFAGTGRCDVKVSGEFVSIDGSAKLALEVNPSFDQYIFIERSARKRRALHSLISQFPGRNAKVIEDDANVALRAICRAFDRRNDRGLLFMDPFGLSVEWATLEELAATKVFDVWYLFPLAGLYRQAAKKLEAIDHDKEAAITRALGTDKWKDRFYSQPRQQNLFAEEGLERDANVKEMLYFISDRLGSLFPKVLPPKILFQDNDRQCGAPLFALYFMVSNPHAKAIGVATNIASHILNKL